MPFFRVLLEGTNLCIPGSEGDAPIIGFFTYRIVWAQTRQAAESEVQATIRQLWTTGRYASRPTAGQLALSVSESGPSNFWLWLTARKGGHLFFAAEPGEA